MPVTVSLEHILRSAEDRVASDVILTAGVAPVLRIAGDMVPLEMSPLSGEECQRLVYSILNREQIARFEREQELDFSLSFENRQRFRCNAFRQRGAVGAVLRLIPGHVPALDSLGLPPVVAEFADMRQGLVLVTGPTGHGKSTTLAAMIARINTTRPCHIVTIEDPIEFVHPNNKAIIEQREVLTDTPSFASALRHALRQAPDVILVGELRDLETIASALTAAETGHLVLATLHTNDTAQTIDRIIDVFPPHQQTQVRTQLSMVLVGVVAQLLLPTPDGRDRVLATEILRVTPAVANMIREQKGQQIPGVIETQARVGMVTMDASIKKHYQAGRITEQTAQRAMKHPPSLFTR